MQMLQKIKQFELRAAAYSDIICCVMKKFMCAAARFVKSEVVLCVALLLAIISMFFVPPDAGYLDYIDWDTLALLFSLMAVMKGFQSAGVFSFLAGKLLKKANTSRKIMLVLVFLPFFLSMLVTNDVSLITFVPFGLIVLRSAKLERLAVPLAVLQTLAANLGSMLTPMGNPQNLYLYNSSGMSFGGLVLLMLPYTALSGAGLFAVIMCFKSVPAESAEIDTEITGKFPIIYSSAGFAVCLLGLFDVIPSLIIAAAVLVFLLIFDRKVLIKVDYSLLATFAALFIFIGNMGNISAVRTFLSSVISGNETLVAVLASQVLSNVPAALLLSGFSSEWSALIVGCNLGGLGTLIASMASLISYKEIAKSYPEKRLKYLLQFTVYNIAFLAALIGLYFIIKIA